MKYLALLNILLSFIALIVFGISSNFHAQCGYFSSICGWVLFYDCIKDINDN